VARAESDRALVANTLRKTARTRRHRSFLASWTRPMYAGITPSAFPDLKGARPGQGARLGQASNVLASCHSRTIPCPGPGHDPRRQSAGPRHHAVRTRIRHDRPTSDLLHGGQCREERRPSLFSSVAASTQCIVRVGGSPSARDANATTAGRDSL
jgi:hypothetical protein